MFTNPLSRLSKVTVASFGRRATPLRSRWAPALCTLLVATVGLADAVTAEPAGATASEDLFVLNAASNTVAQLRPSASNHLVRRYPALIPQALAVSPNGKSIYVGGPTSRLRVIHACSHTDTLSSTIGDSRALVSSIATSASGQDVYVVNPRNVLVGNGLVVTLDAQGHRLHTVTDAVIGSDAAVAPSGYVYVTHNPLDPNFVTILNPNGTFHVRRRIFSLVLFHRYNQEAIAIDRRSGTIYLAIEDSWGLGNEQEHLLVISSHGTLLHDYPSLAVGVESLTVSP